MLCCINRGSDVSSRFHIKQRIFSVRLCASRFGHAARRAVQYCMLYIQQANPQTSLRLMDLCLCTDRFICHKIKTKLQHNKVQMAQDKTDESGSSHMGPQQIHNAAGILKDKYAYGKCIQEQKVNMHFFLPKLIHIHDQQEYSVYYLDCAASVCYSGHVWWKNHTSCWSRAFVGVFFCTSMGES